MTHCNQTKKLITFSNTYTKRTRPANNKLTVVLLKKMARVHACYDTSVIKMVLQQQQRPAVISHIDRYMRRRL
jgi:hypothetical protein